MNLEIMRLKGLILVKPRVFCDDRGFFYESYHNRRYLEAGRIGSFVQDNVSCSKRGVIRGLHYQVEPGEQAKLVSVIQGRIWDVAVDIRPHSPTFGQWEAVELSEDNHWQFYIPVGFAHGYCALSEVARVSYKASSYYDPLLERAVRWDDPFLDIAWPIQRPLLSERDRKALFLHPEKVLS